MILHTVNRSPFQHSGLKDCLAISAANHSILLLEDGVYALQMPLEDSALATFDGRVYALEADLEARGLNATALPAFVQRVDYAGFVDLVASHESVCAWS